MPGSRDDETQKRELVIDREWTAVTKTVMTALLADDRIEHRDVTG